MILRAILALNDEKLQRRLLQKLTARDVLIERARAGGRTWEKILRRAADVIIISEELIPEPLESSVSQLNALPELPTLVVLTASDSTVRHAALLGASCDTVLYAGLGEEQIVAAVEATFETRRHFMRRNLADAGRHGADGEVENLSDFISESQAMRLFMQVVRRVVNSEASLLILGETGVGKEHLAKAIHAAGPHAAGPFLAVNCAALPEQLLESELFGHEEGAFTGAIRSRKGAFELAHGGTLFLDEIGEMPLHLQAKLLRVLQDFEVRRVGGETAVSVDVRIMAASNVDLEAESREKRFRRDLYYRLSVVSLTIPPLRERLEDIPMLVEGVIARLGARMGTAVFDISPSALESLHRYDWPGNVRELINVIERAMLLCEGEEITMDDLPAMITGRVNTPFIPADAADIPPQWREMTLPQLRELCLERIERAYLDMILQQTAGRIDQTAERAGIHPRGLYDKMRRYGLRKEDYRAKSPS